MWTHCHLVVALVHVILLRATRIIDGVVVLGPPVKLHLLLIVWVRLVREGGAIHGERQRERKEERRGEREQRGREERG